MLALIMCLSASAQDFQSPNSILGVGVGIPSFVSVRGEAWFGDQGSIEVGVGLPQSLATDGTLVDWALRWRPEFLCFGCGSRGLLTIGVGVGGTVAPDLTLVGPWGVSAGGDVVATAVGWFTPTFGVQASVRGGGGPAWEGNASGGVTPGFWGFGSVGVAF